MAVRPAFAAAPAPAASKTKPSFDASALDRAVDPCDDFYQFACGSWMKNNPIPGDQAQWGRFNELAEQNRAQLHEILDEAKAPLAKRDATAQKIGDYYAACMDEAAAEKRRAAPLEPLFKEIDAVTDKAQLPKLLGRLNREGVSGFLGFGSGQDYQDATRMIAQADQGGWSLPDRDYYLKDSFSDERRDFRAHVASMFKLAGESAEQAAADAGTVMTLETALAKAAMGRVERREPANVHHKMTLADFQKSTPGFSWKDYTEAMAAPGFAELDVNDPGFFKGLGEAVASQPLPAWKTYLRWKTIHSFAGLLSSDFVNEDFDFFGKRLSGQKELKARWKRCVAQVDSALGEALGKAYVDRHFPPSAKKATREGVREIEAAMKADLKVLPWMSPETRKKALEKLARIANKIGYPDRWRDYSKLEIKPDDLVGNALRASAFEVKRELDKIGRPADRQEWEMTPPTVNAYYDPQMNNINFPAGILKPPFFTNGGDDAVNYGGIGAVEGHELTHGFDDEGRHYDAVGNLKDWWTKEDAEAFEKRAQSLVKEYDAFVALPDAGDDKAKDIHVNGKLTLGENTADNCGLKLAYAAMDKDLDAADRRDIGGFTPRQRFFLGWAQVWCTNRTPQIAKVRAVSDPHSPPQFRVDGTVSNMPEFAQAFSCKPGAAMNPAARNGVW